MTVTDELRAIGERAERELDAVHDFMSSVVRAIQFYHEKFEQFPTDDICDASGKPLLSWRLRLLSFFAPHLAEEFHMDEPWNSPHNLPLASKIPPPFRLRKAGAEDNQKTWLVALRGPNTIFGNGQHRRIQADIGSAPSDIAMLVEADAESAPIWTKPEDLTYDPANPHRGLARHWWAGFSHEPAGMVALADGNIRLIPASVPPEVLRKVLSMDDGPPRLHLPWYAVLDREPQRTLIVVCLLVSAGFIAASVAILWRMYRNKAIWPAELLLLVVGAQQLVFLCVFFYGWRSDVLPPLFAGGDQPSTIMLREWPTVGGIFAAVLVSLLVWPIKTLRIYFGAVALVFAALYFLSKECPRYWAPETALVTIGHPITLALASIPLVALPVFHEQPPHRRGAGHLLAFAALWIPVAWFGYWCLRGFVVLEQPFFVMLE